MAPRCRGQGRDGQVAPILMLRKQRDAHCERPCALCERACALCERGCELAPPVDRRAQAGRGLLVRGGSLTGAPGPGCCCAPRGARVKSKQIGPGRLSGPPRLGTVTADCPAKTALFADERATLACCAYGLALHPPGCRGRWVWTRVPPLSPCCRPWRWPGCRWAPGGTRIESRQPGP